MDGKKKPLRIAPGVELDPDVAGGWTFGILAKKGAGKSYSGRVMAEEMLGAGIPIVALDPTGAWWGLRAGADGSSKGGLQVVIFGGEHGDVPLEPESGKLMADLAADEHVPMVLDMSGFGTRAAERRFAKDFLDRLYRRNRTLMHLFVDEADLFAPQKPMPGDLPLLGVMENLVRRGRLKGIGCTLITQRPAVLNKDVLTQVDVLVLLRLIGPQDRDAVKKWVDGHGDVEMAKTIFDSLAQLQNGESWWWAPEAGLLERTQIRRSRTFDSSPTPTRDAEVATPKSLADVDLEAVRVAMAETIQRADDEDPVKLRARIADLEAAREECERQFQDAVARIPEPAVVEVPVPVIPEVVEEEWMPLMRQVAQVAQRMENAMQEALAAVGGIVRTGNGYSRAPAEWGPVIDPDSGLARAIALEDGVARDRVGLEVAPGKRAAPAGAMRVQPGLEAPLRKGAMRMLQAVADMDPVPQTRAQVARQADVKVTGGTFSTYLGELKRGGYVYEVDGKLTMGESGWDALGGKPERPKSALEVRDLWLRRFTGGAKEMLVTLIEQRVVDLHGGRALNRDGGWMTRLELAERTDLTVSGGTFSTYLGRLRSAGLIDEDKNEEAMVRAADILFLGPAHA